MSFENLSGQSLGQYELREMLGQGGMGAVFRAVQANLKMDVAVKILPSTLAQQTGYLERFNREAEIAAALQHPHIVPTFDYGMQRGISYVVMRLLTGGNLAQRMIQRQNENGPLPSLGEAAHMLNQIASALDYAHAQGVIHRDIKTSNIMFDNQGNAYVVDFGIAKLQGANQNLTSTGMTLGTSAYMPPEQWRSEPLTPAADQYALGVVIYTILTGRIPYQSDTPGGLMYKHFNEMPTPPRQFRADLPEGVTDVLNRALAKKPEDRFPKTMDFAQAFQRTISGHEGQPNGFFTFKVRGAPQPAPLTPISPPTGLPTESLAPRVESTPSEYIATEVQLTPSPIPPIPPIKPMVSPPPNRNRLYWGLGAVIVLLIGAITFLLVNREPSGLVMALSLTPTETILPTVSPTSAPSATIVTPESPTSTLTFTPTASDTATFTATSTPSITPSATATHTASSTATVTASATASSTKTYTPTLTATTTPSATFTPTATLPAFTDNDVVFNVSSPLLWTAVNMKTVGRNTWEIGLDPYIIYDGSLNSCFADYAYIYVQLALNFPNNPDNQSAVIYYVLDGQGDFDNKHIALMPLKPGAEVQTIVYPVRNLVNGTNHRLTRIRLDPADGFAGETGTVHILDFRLIHSGNTSSACPTPTSTRTPTPSPNTGGVPTSTPTSLPSNYYFSNEFNGSKAVEFELPNFKIRDIQGKRAYCGTAISTGSKTLFGTYQSYQQEFTVESSIFLIKPELGYWWVELRVRTASNLLTGYSLKLEADGARLRRADGILLGKNQFTVSDRGWYHLGITVKKNELTAYVNDIIVGSTVIDDMYRAGMAAIGGGNVEMCIDRVVIREAVILPPATPVGLVLPGRIAFTSNRFGNPEIMLLNPSNPASPQRITANNAIDSQPAISPNGNVIAFDTNREGNFDIFAALVNGLSTYSITHSINHESNPAWSHNGNKIAYNTRINTVRQINQIDLNSDVITTISPSKLFHDNNPSWSPDNQSIIFESLREANRDIYKAGIDGKGLTNLTRITQVDSVPDWSPDGKQIAFVSNRDGNNEIYMINADGTNIRRLTNDGADDDQPTWSPDGQYIAFVSDRSGNKDIWVMKANDGSIIANLTAVSNSADYDPDWGNSQNTIVAIAPTVTPQATSTPRPTATSIAFLGVNYEQSFEKSPNGVTGDGWFIKKDEQVYCIDNRTNRYGEFPRIDIALTDYRVTTNYSIEVRIRFTSKTGHVAILTRLDSNGLGYRHSAGFAANSYAVGQYYYGGSTGVDLGFSSIYIQPNVWYVLRAEVDGSTIRTFLNGQLASTRKDTHRDRGAKGLEVGPNGQLCIDDLVVRSLDRTDVALAQAQRGQATANARLRLGPGTDFDAVSSVTKGEHVFILDKDSTGKWFLIRRDENNGIQGWVSADFIQLSS